MYILIDEREMVTDVYSTGFERVGISSLGLDGETFGDWISSAQSSELSAVDAILIGECAQRKNWAKMIRSQGIDAPIIALNEANNLSETLELFAAGVDDVVRKPVHVSELQARVGAIRRRSMANVITSDTIDLGILKVYFDGRDPEVAGHLLPLPRRERYILEYLARNIGRRVTKSQIFSNVYGVMNVEVEENVIESHISKLKKKLRLAAGRDLIDSKRYVGYCLIVS